MSAAPLPRNADSGSIQPAHSRWGIWIWLGLAVLLSAFAFWGMPGVPFHPDESTQLFMSQDFNLWVTRPFSMAWSPDESGDLQMQDLRTHYRLVDAPLTKYLLGLGRNLGGIPALPVDWDWTKTWDENQIAGAVPSRALLLTGRAMLTLLIPLDLWLIYRIGKRIQGEATSLLGVVLFGLNALVLVHDRRAMAEAALTCGVLFAVWSFLDGSRKPWLAGLAVALAVNAKQSAAVLLPVGLLAVSWPLSAPTKDGLKGNHFRLPRLLANWAQYGAVFLAITLLLNPFLWRHPLQAAQAAWFERKDLLQGQVADYTQPSPENPPVSPATRLASLLAHAFMTPPAFAETANYTQQTQASEEAYLAIPGHDLLRGFLGGGIMLLLTLAGMILGVLQMRRATPKRRQDIFLLLLSTIALGVGIYWLMVIPWQRYVMPLAPMICLWIAYAITTFLNKEEFE